MGFQGLDPESARDFSTTLRQTGSSADDLASEVTAALTLSQLESDLPNHLVITGDEMETVGVVVAARADIVDGFVLDPEVLAEDIGLPVSTVEKAIATFDDPDTDQNAITPLLDAVIESRQAAEGLRSDFLNMPALGDDPELDAALIELGSWLPKALKKDKISDSNAEEYSEALQVLAGALGLKQTSKRAKKTGKWLGSASGAEVAARILGEKLFERIEKVFELDQRVAKAAGLPRVKDMLDQNNRDPEGSFSIFKRYVDVEYQESWDALDDVLPAVLVGDIDLPEDTNIHKLIVEFAGAVGFDGQGVNGAVEYLRDRRLLQESLIPGDFEVIDGPVIVWSKKGVETSILAGQRNGVLNEQSQQVADLVAENVLVDIDGSDEAIELSDEQQQALVAAIVSQNGEEFVMDSDNIQRQIVSALSLIGRQKSLTAQRKMFAKSIEAFRSLAVVGSPAVTYRQLKKVVGDEVTDELSHKYLTARSEKKTGKRPQFLALISHWGIPGGDKIKLKKRDFKFEFDDDGSLSKVKNKKLSKWKRFKRTVKAIGKSIWKEWKSNPWKYLFMGPAGLLPGANQVADGFKDWDFGDIWDGTVDMTKSAALIASLVVPGTNAASVAALASSAVGLIEAIDDKDALAALTSTFGIVGQAAGFYDAADTIGSTANLIQGAADVGEGVIGAVDAGINLADAIDDDNLLAALGSGFSMLGHASSAVSSGAELANSAGAALDGELIAPERVQGLLDNKFMSEQAIQDNLTHTVVSADTIATIDGITNTTGHLGNLTAGTGVVLNAIEGDDLVGTLNGAIGLIGHGIQAASDPRGLTDDLLGLSDPAKENGWNLGGALVKLSGQVSAGQTIVNAAQTGMVSGVGEGLVDLFQVGVDPSSAAGRGLKFADEALDLVMMAELGYVPDYGTIFDQLAEVGGTAANLGGGLEPPTPKPPTPTVTNGEGGAHLVDFDNDGLVDAEVSIDDQGRRVVRVDTNQDGTVDQTFVDTDNDGSADALAPDGPTLDVGTAGADLDDQDLDHRFRTVGPTGNQGEIRVNELLAIPEGYSLSELANLHGVTVGEILAINPQITNPDLIRTGDEIVLPEGAQAQHYLPERNAATGTGPDDVITLEELRQGGRRVLLDFFDGPMAAAVEVGGDALVAGIDLIGGGDVSPASTDARQQTVQRLQALADSAVAVGGYVVDAATGERHFVDDVRELAFETLDNIGNATEGLSEAANAGDGEGLIVAGAEVVGAVVGAVKPRNNPFKPRGEPGSILHQDQFDGIDGVRRSTVEGIVGSPQDRLRTENALPSLPADHRMDRAHLAGAGLGIETEVGLGYASIEVNRSIQARVEQQLADLHSTLRPGEQVKVKVSSETFPLDQTGGRPYLRDIQYEFEVVGDGPAIDRPKAVVGIEIESDGVPTADSPVKITTGEDLLDLN